jgi:hypothetical protein
LARHFCMAGSSTIESRGLRMHPCLKPA